MWIITVLILRVTSRIKQDDVYSDISTVARINCAFIIIEHPPCSSTHIQKITLTLMAFSWAEIVRNGFCIFMIIWDLFLYFGSSIFGHCFARVFCKKERLYSHPSITIPPNLESWCYRIRAFTKSWRLGICRVVDWKCVSESLKQMVVVWADRLLGSVMGEASEGPLVQACFP